MTSFSILDCLKCCYFIEKADLSENLLESATHWCQSMHQYNIFYNLVILEHLRCYQPKSHGNSNIGNYFVGFRRVHRRYPSASAALFEARQQNF